MPNLIIVVHVPDDQYINRSSMWVSTWHCWAPCESLAGRCTFVVWITNGIHGRNAYSCWLSRKWALLDQKTMIKCIIAPYNVWIDETTIRTNGSLYQGTPWGDIAFNAIYSLPGDAITTSNSDRYLRAASYCQMTFSGTIPHGHGEGRFAYMRPFLYRQSLSFHLLSFQT